MIKQEDLSKTFKEYKGGKDTAAALDFIKAQFIHQLPPKKTVEIHVISAAYRREVRIAFDEVKTKLFGTRKQEIFDMVKQLKRRQREIVRGCMLAANSSCCVPAAAAGRLAVPVA
jgi:hypothetical protein